MPGQARPRLRRASRHDSSLRLPAGRTHGTRAGPGRRRGTRLPPGPAAGASMNTSLPGSRAAAARARPVRPRRSANGPRRRTVPGGNSLPLRTIAQQRQDEGAEIGRLVGSVVAAAVAGPDLVGLPRMVMQPCIECLILGGGDDRSEADPPGGRRPPAAIRGPEDGDPEPQAPVIPSAAKNVNPLAGSGAAPAGDRNPNSPTAPA